jgi:CheY-like chemotaxis protein
MLGQRSEEDQRLLDGFLVKPVTASMLFDAIADSGAAHGLTPSTTQNDAPSAQRLAGMRLLLAEDNANNQQVACELLEDEGATVQIANHGQEAVEAVAAADPPFDVVLMDLHMPVMDGFTATRRIRQDLARTQLPIVAMTANAMASDREACLAAGMNDHVGKPFELDHLVRVLRRLAGRPARDDAPRSATNVELPRAVVESAATAGVEIGRALDRLGGKIPVYERMLHTFTNDLSTLPQRLQQHVAAAETEAATRLLHTLKGLAATLGSAALAESAAQGERALAQAPAREAVDAICAEACAAIEQAQPALQALLQALQASSPAPAANSASEGNAPPDRAVLQELATLLENSDMRATELVTRLPPQASPAWRELDDAVANLDFERALGLCRSMLTDDPVQTDIA